MDLKEVTFLYENGMSGQELALKYNTSRYLILKFLRENKVIIRPSNNVSKISKDTQSKIIQQYINGDSSLIISEQFGLNFCTILNVLKRNNVTIRNRSKCQQKLNINHEAFSVLTPEACYWTGFLMADGGICKNRITLSLGVKDEEHIHKFKTFLRSEHKITQHKNMIRIATVSAQIVNDLAKLGVTERKTFTAKCCDKLINCRDFWRGVVDGDGNISIVLKRNRKTKYPQLSLVGSEHLVKQFTDFINKHCLTNKIPFKPNGKSIWQITCGASTAVKIITILYGKNPVVSLNRKQEIANKVIYY